MLSFVTRSRLQGLHWEWKLIQARLGSSSQAHDPPRTSHSGLMHVGKPIYLLGAPGEGPGAFKREVCWYLGSDGFTCSLNLPLRVSTNWGGPSPFCSQATFSAKDI